MADKPRYWIPPMERGISIVIDFPARKGVRRLDVANMVTKLRALLDAWEYEYTLREMR